jgi:hypothetical protein
VEAGPKGSSGFGVADIRRADLPAGTQVWSRKEGVEVREFRPDAALCKGMSMKSLQPGLHGERTIHDFWIAQLEPSFEPDAQLMVARGTRGLEGIFQVGPEDPFNFTPSRSVALPGWEDPVAKLLQTLPLLAPPVEPELRWMSTDGIGYTFRVMSKDVEATLRFSNPREGPFQLLERAIAEAAERLAAAQVEPHVRAYFEKVRGYFRG